jgi:polyisoprenoid-binding protein YceI
MNRSLVLAAAVLALAVGGGAVWWFSQGTEAPTVGVTAPPVATTEPATTAPESEATTSTTVDSDGRVTYVLTEESQAMFTIDEELRGEPKTVLGVSTIVLGELLVDPEDPSSLQIGVILINARDFTTDASNRDRAIRGPILDADNFEFISFTPTSIDGLDSVGAEFTVTGDLTIREVSNAVTFVVAATVNADGTISGVAEATVDRTDWGLNIPSAPGVANVSETVNLILEFRAAPSP